MEAEKTSIKPQGSHPYCEKLVWQGSFEGVHVRVRIVQDSEYAPIVTVIERHATTLDMVGRWFEQDCWEQPERSAPWSLFVEGFIDLLGRPAWDTRAKTSSSYPVELNAGIEW